MIKVCIHNVYCWFESLFGKEKDNEEDDSATSIVWYKREPEEKMWWKDTSDRDGEHIFSFDKKKEYNIFRDYPQKLSEEEKKIFDEENPCWAEFFGGK